MDSYVDYVPETIRWPELPESQRAQLSRLPFWQEAVSTENVTSNTVTAAAQLEADPAIRQAIELQGFEEKRHARLLQALTAHYRIPIEAPPPYQPRSVESAFLQAGFGECLDSFFAFGLFALARDSGYFAPGLVAIFEPVIQEEARHILFFVNWVRHRRAGLAWWKRPLFRLKCGAAIFKQIAARVKTARALGRGERDTQDHFTFTARQDLGRPMTLRSLLELCLAESDRRLCVYDARLARPRLAPGFARLALRFLAH